MFFKVSVLKNFTCVGVNISYSSCPQDCNFIKKRLESSFETGFSSFETGRKSPVADDYKLITNNNLRYEHQQKTTINCRYKGIRQQK